MDSNNAVQDYYILTFKILEEHLGNRISKSEIEELSHKISDKIRDEVFKDVIQLFASVGRTEDGKL